MDEKLQKLLAKNGQTTDRRTVTQQAETDQSAVAEQIAQQILNVLRGDDHVGT